MAFERPQTRGVHTIGPITTQVLNTLKDPTIDAPNPCPADTQPTDDDTEMVSIPFGQKRNKSGTTLKIKPGITKERNEDNNPATSQIERALQEVSNTFYIFESAKVRC